MNEKWPRQDEVTSDVRDVRELWVSWRTMYDHVRSGTMYAVMLLDGDKYHADERGLRIDKLDLRDNGTYECRAEVSSHGNLKVRTLSVDIQCQYIIYTVRQ